MKKWLSSVGSMLLNPIRQIGSFKLSDHIVNFSSKNPWFKVLLSFIIVGLLIAFKYFL